MNWTRRIQRSTGEKPGLNGNKSRQEEKTESIGNCKQFCFREEQRVGAVAVEVDSRDFVSVIYF